MQLVKSINFDKKNINRAQNGKPSILVLMDDCRQCLFKIFQLVSECRLRTSFTIYALYRILTQRKQQKNTPRCAFYTRRVQTTLIHHRLLHATVQYTIRARMNLCCGTVGIQYQYFGRADFRTPANYCRPRLYSFRSL